MTVGFMFLRLLGGLVYCVALVGCSSSAPERAAASRVPVAAAPAADVSIAPPAQVVGPRASDRPRVVVLGDSLTAGLGVAPDQSYPAILQRRLDSERLAFEVVNAGVSGDTSAGGLRRLDWSMEGNVRVLVVALGGNDGLRGLPVTELKANLTTIVERAREKGVAVLLCGMEAPPNFGSEYTAAFRQVYVELSKVPGVAFVPFLLDGVAGDPTLNQADGIHPNPVGAEKVAEVVWRALRPLVMAAAS